MSVSGAHLLFLFVSAGVSLFAVAMGRRLRTRYPDDSSRQMQSMLGFLRGIAFVAAVLAALVAADLARRLLIS